MEQQEKINPWETLSSEIVYKNDWISVEESKVITPAQKNGVYGVVRFKNKAVSIIPLDEEHYTWIVGQFRYTTQTFEWEIVEGGVPFEEDTLEGAKRELLEETGIVAEDWDLIMDCQLSNSVTDEVGYTFIAKNLTFFQSNPEETEKLTIKKIHFKELLNMAMNGEIKDLFSLASIFKVAKILNY